MYYQPQIDFRPDQVLAYLRKSQSDDPLLTVEEVLAKHETILDEWAQRTLGGVVPEENKFREVVSGETIKGRPEVQKVLRLMESPRIRAILVVEPQRLTRGDLEDIGRMMKLLKHTHPLVLTPPRSYDLSDEYDWDAFERELKRGNDYLEYTKKILNRGRLLSVSQGNYIGSHPPYGYDRVFVTEGKRKYPTLAENKTQADVVRMIFHWYVDEDLGYQKICHRLDGMGIQPPRSEYWSPAALKDLLSNVHYVGKVRWNWRKTVTTVSDSEIINTRPRARDGGCLVYEGKHPAIVPEALFQAAQEKQGRNPRVKGSAQVVNPLAGLLYCQCGRAMVYRTYTKGGVERSAPRLLCQNQSNCGTSSCGYAEIIEQVKSILRQNIHDFNVELRANNQDARRRQEALVRQLEAKARELDKKEIAQWEAQADPDPAKRMPEHVFRALNEKLLREKQAVQQSLQEARTAMPSPADWQEKLARFTDALNALDTPDLSAAEKNRLLKACIEKIIYRREKLQRQKRAANWASPPVDLSVELKT